MTTIDTASVHPRLSDLQRIMQPVDRAPTLFRINGIGPTLIGRLRYPYMEPYYVSMQFFTLFFIPLFPLGFYVVKTGGGNSYYFVGQLRHADLRAFAGPEGMRRLWLSLLRHPTVWIGLVLLAFVVAGIFTG